MTKLGLIAGSGQFPLQLAEAAIACGWELVVFAIRGEAQVSDYKPITDSVHLISVGKFGEFMELVKAEYIRDVVMAGKLQKKNLFNNFHPDERALKIASRLKNKADDTLLGAIAEEMASEGMTLHPSTFCIEKLLAPEGTLTASAPTEGQWKDIRYGWGIAKEIGRMDIGQTVVIKDCAVMAVESIEGTDEAIIRGGSLASGGATVVKVAKPNQDVRFDMPTTGLNTIESMITGGAKALAIEAGWTVLLDKEEVLARADAEGIAIVSCKHSDMIGEKEQ